MGFVFEFSQPPIFRAESEREREINFAVKNVNFSRRKASTWKL